MSLNLNKVILGGRITSDPQLKQTPQGISVTSFSVAVNRKGKDAPTDFINCQAWRQTAEFICSHFKKGNAICVAGSIQTRSWDDPSGQKRYATEINVEEAYFVESKSTESAQPIIPNYEEVAPDETLPF
jgi:single-strand DNA-binding protein